jgi:hypothetical protein
MVSRFFDVAKRLREMAAFTAFFHGLRDEK